MTRRIDNHPVLEVPTRQPITFTWAGQVFTGYEGETISAALMAAGVEYFGHHPKDGSPQGLFCANGQCSACLVMADGVPVKGCMTPLRRGMALAPVEGVPELPEDDTPAKLAPIPVLSVEVLVIGGGPAGLAAALELGASGIDTLLVDDKCELGGKLVLQTHKFFGSERDSRAGTRGYEIGRVMAALVTELPTIQVWLDTTAVAVYSDGVVGLVTGTGLPNDSVYRLVRPRHLLVATGARERMLPFPGNTLPGNRDLVACSRKLLVVGAGNVGLIAAYHALQAGMDVAAVVEFLPAVGGYAVHADKLRRLGVPILTRHTILRAEGDEHVEKAVIAAVEEDGTIVQGSERTLAVDTILIAVGLAEVDEFYRKAVDAGLPVLRAGDAAEIAEASAAMIDGRIAGRQIAKTLRPEGLSTIASPDTEHETILAVLRSKPGATHPWHGLLERGKVEPVFHCLQEIPCNPCTSVCPEGAIATVNDTITGVPYLFKPDSCRACLKCVRICPGLAITLVDSRRDHENPLVTLPWELPTEDLGKDTPVMVVDREGEPLGIFSVTRVLKPSPDYPATSLVQLSLPRELAGRAAGIRPTGRPPTAAIAPTPNPSTTGASAFSNPDISDIEDRSTAVVCRCERVTETEIRAAIRAGAQDLNQLKALTRVGMGSCGGKTCRPLLEPLLRQEGVPPTEVTPLTERPLFIEVPLGTLAGSEGRRT